nr:uncharacterized protein LOC131758073 isoform X1 [Kogia breviceps]
MARAATPAAPRLLRVALLLLLVVAAGRRAAGATRLPASPGRDGGGWVPIPGQPPDRVCPPRRGACGHRTALLVPADLAGDSPQEHPEREGDASRTPLRPNGSRVSAAAVAVLVTPAVPATPPRPPARPHVDSPFSLQSHSQDWSGSLSQP